MAPLPHRAVRQRSRRGSVTAGRTVSGSQARCQIRFVKFAFEPRNVILLDCAFLKGRRRRRWTMRVWRVATIGLLVLGTLITPVLAQDDDNPGPAPDESSSPDQPLQPAPTPTAIPVATTPAPGT